MKKTMEDEIETDHGDSIGTWDAELVMSGCSGFHEPMVAVACQEAKVHSHKLWAGPYAGMHFGWKALFHARA